VHAASDRAEARVRVTVGLVVNPVAACDVRRLTSLARNVDVHHRVNIVARVLRGLAAAGVDDVHFMAEPCQLVERAGTLLAGALPSAGRTPSLRPIPSPGTAVDWRGTVAAAAWLAEAGTPCVVTVGGDGTNRAVALGWPDVVFAPFPGGTNNAFAPSVDPTVVGLAAGLFARDRRRHATHAQVVPYLAVDGDGIPHTRALVDVAVVDEPWAGAHALWDPTLLVEAVVTRTDPTVTGLAGVAGMLRPDGGGWGAVRLRFGPSGTDVLAPLGPGQLAVLSVAGWESVGAGDEVVVGGGRVTLAFDGERETVLQPGQRARVRLVEEGPTVIDAAGLVRQAAVEGVFTQQPGHGPWQGRHRSDDDESEA
jgi:predicted polyphosphate/ATP-dependent NAD kinase